MQEKIRIPVPDPLGILGDLTKDMPVVLFDPLKDAKEIEKAKQESEVREEPNKESIVDTRIEKYEYHLREAYKVAPCSGCKNLVQSALVGVRIYKQMESGNRKREDFTDDEIQKIKEQVRKDLETLIP